VIEQGSNTELRIKTIEFTRSYVDGYVEGVNYFKKEFGVNSNILYGPHAAEFIKNLHHNQYHKWHNSFLNGWEDVRYHYPTIISDSVMHEFGYFAGILSEVEEMKNIHRTIFLKYDKCDVIESPSSMPKVDSKSTPAAVYYYEEREVITPENMGEIAPKVTKTQYSIAQYACALDVKGITISLEGVGIMDGINYIEKFGLTPGRALYNRLNDFTKGRRDSSKLMPVAKEIIKKYKL
jgi:hypothetical protein